MVKKNIIEKIWDMHKVSQMEGHPAIVAIDCTLIHEVTSAPAFESLKERHLAVYDRKYTVATIDHSIPTRVDRVNVKDVAAKKQIALLKKNVEDFGIRFFDYDSGYQGIVHVMGPELGLTQPGMTLVCGDSHTATHGAFGTFAFGVGTSVLSHVLATGCLLMHKPKVMRVHFQGMPGRKVYSKDAILKLISVLGINGAAGYVIEYTGEFVRRLSMEKRMTLCNMSIECGAIAGLISPDETTFDYIKNKPFAPSATDWQAAVKYWQSIASDENCHYDKSIVVDIENLKPMITWGTNPAQAIEIDQCIPEPETLPETEKHMAEMALNYIQLNPGSKIEGVSINWAFVGSCTNGRIEDLREVAAILKGNKVHPSVTMYIVPGSEQVRQLAEREGLDKIFKKAGADFRMPGCSLCIAMNEDKIPPNQRCISTTNRNFVGRQGSGSYTHLASPATVATSAIFGKITSPEYLHKEGQ